MVAVHDTVARIRRDVQAVGEGRAVLAVSGGMDSMVLLDACAGAIDPRDMVVATFDHGTGAWATDACELVGERARFLGLRCVTGRAKSVGRSEAEWRSQRWRFLRDSARRVGARVVTAHTLDDQIETVMIRALRGAGPRGLAGLLARSPVLRPLSGTSRTQIADYARARRVEHVTDPSNFDRRHLRNRVRLDLLPALEAAAPGFSVRMLELSKKAASWRAQMEAIALTFPVVTESPYRFSFERSPLSRLDLEGLRQLWPALAARAGVVLDRRGTERLAKFTTDGESGQQIQLAGGIRVHLERNAIKFARPDTSDADG